MESNETDGPEKDSSFKPLSRWWAIPALAVSALIWLAVSQVGPSEMGEAAGFAAAANLIIGIELWTRDRHGWFWPFVTTTMAIHTIAIVLIPWSPTHKFEKVDLNFVWVDFFLSWGLVALVKLTYGFFRKSPAES